MNHSLTYNILSSCNWSMFYQESYEMIMNTSSWKNIIIMMIKSFDHHNNFIEKMFETFFFMWIHQKGVYYTCLKIAPYWNHLESPNKFPSWTLI
jgi:hypothetical protein